MKIYTHFPSKKVNNEDLVCIKSDIDVNRLGKKLGIETRRVVGGETGLDLAYEACKKIDKSDLNGVDFIIYCTQSPEYFLPTTACILQKKLGLSNSCGALDYNLGCSGYIYGLAMAKGLLVTKVAKRVLLVTAETYSKYIHNDDWTNRAIFGDAATATLLEKEDCDKIGEFDLGTDGSGAENLIVKGGAGKSGYVQDFQNENLLQMNGPEVFQFTLDNVPFTINQCLNKNGKSMDEIDYFIFHQANSYMLKNLRKKIGIPSEKFYSNMKDVGNTVSNTIPIAFKDSISKGLVKSGDCVLLCGFGVGYSWGTTLITV